MVDGVLHNACLRLEDSGDGLDGMIRATTRRRWFGRSSLAVGGAASLAVGAVLGGALEGVPILLPPPASASASPQVESSHSGEVSTPAVFGGFASHDLTSLATKAGTPSVPESVGAKSGPQVAAPVESAVASGAGTGAGVQSGTIVPSNGKTTAQRGTITPSPAPSPGGTGNVVGQALTTVSEVASQLPVVGSTVSGVVGAIGSAVGSLSSPSSSGSSSSGIASATQSLVKCANGLLVANLLDCPVDAISSVVGGL